MPQPEIIIESTSFIYYNSIKILKIYFQISIACRSCGREGHNRKIHLNCAMNTITAPENQTSVRNPAKCRFCGCEGHLRKNHRKCGMNSDSSLAICRFCGREGHSRRSHRNCGMNPANATNIAATTPIICPACGKGGGRHTRTHYSNYAMNRAVSNNPNRAALVICRSCGREGHSRTSYSNCALNSTILGKITSQNIAHDPTVENEVFASPPVRSEN